MTSSRWSVRSNIAYSIERLYNVFFVCFFVYLHAYAKELIQDMILRRAMHCSFFIGLTTNFVCLCNYGKDQSRYNMFIRLVGEHKKKV